LGVKNIAREFLYCSYFRSSPNVLITHATEKHEELKNKVRKLLEEEYNVVCEAEKDIILPSGVRGKIDLLCRGEQVDIIVEVKSSRLSKLSLIDAVQLSLYAYGYKKSNSHRNLDLYLAYEESRNEPVLIKIEGKLRNDLEKISEAVANDLGESSDSDKPRILSFLCRFCDSNCPFKSQIRS
jgi:CRISPR/Cas system-associated exonuclease Cas4 (RecB family)